MDEETKAELLTFLIAGQLLAYARCGDWLRTDHLIESCQIWLSSNGASCDWLERAPIVAASRDLAIRAQHLAIPRDDAGLLRLFNLHAGWFLDYRSPVVQEIHALSVAYLHS